MDAFLERGGTVCICPLTEANFGDGLANVAHIRARAGRICLGSDSNARISMTEEMRWLEYGQRLAKQSRGVIVDPDGNAAAALLEAATRAGSQSLGIPAGIIRAGRLADFATVDLAHPDLAGWTDETLPAALIFGAGNGVIAETCVAGGWT